MIFFHLLRTFEIIRMRFNERELIAMANCTKFTIQGILWKRVKLGAQYKDRFCSLKDNLFFYHTVALITSIDGTIVKQRPGELLGVVVIENMVVQELPIDERHRDQKFGFSIYYRSQETDSGIPSKFYEFRCATREVQGYWMESLSRCSFSSLRRRYKFLRDEFTSLNVDLPPNQLFFEEKDRAPQITFSNVQTFVPRGKHNIEGVCVSPSAPVRKLIDIDSPLKRISSYVPKRPEYKGLELKLACSNLIPYPDVGYYIEVLSGSDKQFVSFARTETIYNCSQADFCSTILLDKDKLLSPRTSLVFHIKQLQKERTDLGVEMSINTQHIATIPITNLTLKTESVIMTEDLKASITIKTYKPIIPLYLKPQKFYEKFHKHFHDANFCTQRTPCDLLFLNPLYIYSIKRTYDFSNAYPTSPQNTQQSKLRGMEITAESPYNNIIPVEYLRLCLRDNRSICNDLISLGPLLSVLEIHKQKLVASLEQQRVSYNSIIEELVELQYFFHASSQRGYSKLSFLPINLHIHKFISTDETPSMSPIAASPSPVVSPLPRISVDPVSALKGVPIIRTHSDTQVTTSSHHVPLNTCSYVTMGAPTHHVAGFRKGSILSMLRRGEHFPFYVFEKENPSRRYIELIDELRECLYTFTEYKDFLMRTVANSAFVTSQEALAGISRTMQRIFTLLESEEIQSGIDEFNQITGIVSSGLKTATLNRSQFAQSPEPKTKKKPRELVVRHSWFPGNAQLISDFSQPLISPNDTKHPAQAKLSHTARQASILQTYIDLTDKVEVVSSHILGMRGQLADISQHGLLVHPKIDLVSWSDELIPILSSILLKVSNLFSTAQKGLTLKRMQFERSIDNYAEILERHDVIMSQLLTGLVTSFAQTFQTQAESYSHLIAMTSFLEKCTRIGYLFSVESYLSTMDTEKYMLEDLAFGIQQLSSVRIRLACGCCHDHPEITGSRISLKIIIPICTAYYKLLPARLRENDIHVYPLLFSRSVSCEYDQTEVPNSAFEFIASTNKQSILALKNYYEFCYQHQGILLHPLTKRVAIIEKLTSKLSASNFDLKFNNIYDMELFHLVEQASRELEGGIVVMCKSAKDRTGCAVTLQQAQYMQDTYPDLISEECKERVVNVMRMSGTTLDICAKNTNKPLFAFNPNDLHFLPPSLSPPIEVCSQPLMS